MLTDEQIIETIERVIAVPDCDVELRPYSSGPSAVIYIDDRKNCVCYRQVFFINQNGKPDVDYLEFTTGEYYPDGKTIDWSGEWDLIDNDDLPEWVNAAFDRAFTAFMMLMC